MKAMILILLLRDEKHSAALYWRWGDGISFGVVLLVIAIAACV